MAKPIQIVGGGLAGLTLGIALRKREVPVTVFEAGNYPRHRVCGEFINGRGLSVLDELGLAETMVAARAVRAESAAFFTDRSRSTILKLPAAALCVSRFTLDRLLADEFCKAGGELRTNTRWNDAGVQASACPDALKHELQREGIVRAAGRRPEPVENGWRWFGLKAHARNVSLTADLEMHLGQDGYIGVCRLAEDEVNICGLFRRNGNSEAIKNGFDRLRGDSGSILRERLSHAQFDENSFCSVAGLSLRPQRAVGRAECCIGDALTMIPPVTGNGMSIAFESARLAVEPLVAFSHEKCSWTEARAAIARRCDEQFSRRLAWADRLQRMLLSPAGQRMVLMLAGNGGWFWRWAFERTR